MRARLKRERFIPENALKLEYTDAKAVAYIYQLTENDIAVVGYTGRKTKNDYHTKFRTSKQAQEFVAKRFANLKIGVDRDIAYKARKKQELKDLKDTIKPGVLLHTTFSYNMTFNDFFQVLERKGSKVTIQAVNKVWVGGDIGYTGDVSATTELVGDPFEVKFTTVGLKVQDRYASICTTKDKFYENHMD